VPGTTKKPEKKKRGGLGTRSKKKVERRLPRSKDTHIGRTGGSLLIFGDILGEEMPSHLEIWIEGDEGGGGRERVLATAVLLAIGRLTWQPFLKTKKISGDLLGKEKERKEETGG